MLFFTGHNAISRVPLLSWSIPFLPCQLEAFIVEPANRVATSQIKRPFREYTTHDACRSLLSCINLARMVPMRLTSHVCSSRTSYSWVSFDKIAGPAAGEVGPVVAGSRDPLESGEEHRIRDAGISMHARVNSQVRESGLLSNASREQCEDRFPKISGDIHPTGYVNKRCP